jgi:hypothetical protein
MENGRSGVEFPLVGLLETALDSNHGTVIDVPHRMAILAAFASITSPTL